MKKILLSLLSCFAISASAQYYVLPGAPGNPNGTNAETTEYPVGGGLPTTWTNLINGASASGTYSAVQSLPFPFLFNGDTVTTYRASNTGIVTFSQVPLLANNSSATAAALYGASVPDSSIVVLGLLYL